MNIIIIYQKLVRLLYIYYMAYIHTVTTKLYHSDVILYPIDTQIHCKFNFCLDPTLLNLIILFFGYFLV